MIIAIEIIMNSYKTLVKTYSCPSSDLKLRTERRVKKLSTASKDTKFPPKSLQAFESWKLSYNLHKSVKIFILNGNYPIVREALLQRGWFENVDKNSMYFDLKWSCKARTPIGIKDWQAFNHFERNSELCTKTKLTINLSGCKKAASFYPTTFVMDSSLSEDFLDYFRALHAINLLKSQAIDSEKAYVCVLIAKRYLKYIQRNERNQVLVSNLEWKLIQSKKSVKKLMRDPSINVKEAVQSTLDSLQKNDFQFNANGKSNLWVVKPGKKSRGRQIGIFSRLKDIESHIDKENSWVIQKYIENPLLINNRKFDIRQWVLVTAVDPLTIYVYRDSYLRFSVESFDLENTPNLFIHLTNNSISKRSSKFSPADSMWHIQQFREYLINLLDADVWEQKIFPRIKKIIKRSVISAGRLGLRKKNTFELFGYDFLIDEDLKPWLLEINSSPAMDYSTEVTESLVKEVLNDVVKIVVDKNSRDTGKFILCHKAKSRLKH